MKTKIIKRKGDWQEVVDDCRFTVGKESLGHEPSVEFKKKILISEHSPIRDILIKWIWEEMPHWITVHWVRHKNEKFVRTQRTDRTGVARDKLPQDEPQNYKGEANIQQLIDIWRKRLCRQCSPETREYAEDFKAALHDIEPEISDVLVPNCIYRCGCPEPSNCGWFKNIACNADPLMASTDIQQRYDAYNKYFWDNFNAREKMMGKEEKHR